MMIGDVTTYRIVQHEMSSENRVRLIEVARLGMQWVAGIVTLDEVEKRLGFPRVIGIPGKETTYSFSNGDFGVFLIWNPTNEKSKQRIDSRKFEISLEDDVRVAMQRDELKNILGLKRTEIGELIDGVRRETLAYYNPAPFPGRDLNSVHLNYRLPMPGNSDFDVYASFDYQRLPEQAGSKVENTENFRRLEISRWYLTPVELQQREQFKRQKYGYMNLRTGMLCPETGWWEGWTAHNSIDKEVVRAGNKFPQALLDSEKVDRGGSRLVDAQWVWHGTYDERA